MRLTDRLSAAVRVPDNRAASIIPHSFHFFPTFSLSNKDETVPQRAILRPKDFAFVLERSLNESSVSSDRLSSSDFYGCKFEHGLRNPVACSCRWNFELLATLAIKCLFFSWLLYGGCYMEWWIGDKILSEISK